MSISNISSSINLAPTLEFSGTQARPVKPRVAVDQLIASLPGNSGRVDDAVPQEFRRIAVDIAQISKAFNKKLHFVIDHESSEVIVKVIDKSTDKVIKILPPEELQRLHRKLKETIGFLFNEQV